MTPLAMVQEWKRGCSCATPGKPEECAECTRGLLDALEPALKRQLAEAHEALAAANRLFEEALPKFNWGASALDANAIRLLNEVPAKVRAQLKFCPLCGGEGHLPADCPWLGETPKGIVGADFAELEARTAAAVAAGVPGVILPGAPCPTCGAKGFDKSRLGPDRCTFCDGTEGGCPPEEAKAELMSTPVEALDLSMNRPYLEEACESVDASVFSGDVLFDDRDRTALKGYMLRWARAIAEHEEASDEPDEG